MNVNGVRYMQYLATISATSFLTNTGIYISWSSPTIPKLISSESPIQTTLTPLEASAVASAFQLGYIPGGILAGFLVARLGPKKSLLIAAVPFSCAWIAVLLAKGSVTLCFGRFFAGIGSAIATTAVPIYNGEVADKDIRGKLGSTCSFLIIVGNVFVLTVGPFISYATLAMVSFCFPLIFGLIFWFMPESPYYLVKSKRLDDARRNLEILSDKSTDDDILQKKLDEITNTVEQDMRNKASLWEFLSGPAYRKSLLILVGMKLIQQFSGMTAVDVYLQTIVQSSKSSISPENFSIIFGLIQLLAVFTTGMIVDRAGRKPILLASTLGSAVALSLEGFYFYLQANGSSLIETLSWLPTAALLLFLVMNTSGLGTLPFILLGEIFPTNIKSYAVSLYEVLHGIISFTVILGFEPVSRIWGMYTVFFVFTGASIFGFIFILAVLPETKQKTFMEIQSELFNRKAYRTNGETRRSKEEICEALPMMPE